ncbi:hypothetical protein KJ633_01020, partial [bacterium]|nr:hypothetical protein [bacterium]
PVSALRIFLAVVFFAALSGAAVAAEFGKNQLYTKTFDWQSCETKHFNIYFYPSLSGRINDLADGLEASEKEVSDFLGMRLKKKPNFLFFETHPDFHSNRLFPVGWGTGGFAEPMKNRFVMPCYTSPREMRHIIGHEYTHIHSFDIFYGGFWRSLALVRTMVYPIPLWMQEGLAEFTSDIWDAEDAAALRDIYLNKLIISSEDMVSFSHLEGYRVYLAYKQSQKMIIFIAAQYGREKVPELIKQFPQVWEQNIALKKVINMDSKAFDKNFADYLEGLYGEVCESRNSPDSIGKLISPEFSFYRAGAPLFTEQGEFFISSGYGYDEIILRKNGKTRRLLKKKKNYFDRIADSLAYSNGELIFYAWKNAKAYLVYYGLEGRNKGKMRLIDAPFADVRQIKAMPDGDLLIAADMNCQSDIFLWNNADIINLTNDRDYEDSFADDPRGQKIIYSCERDNQLDLREIKIASGKKSWLTSTKYDEKRPVLSKEGLYFINEKGGFSDIYFGRFGQSSAENITAVKTGITDFTVSDDGKIAFVCQWMGSRGVYLLNESSASVKNYLSSRDENFLKRGIDIRKSAAFMNPEGKESDVRAVAGIENAIKEESVFAMPKTAPPDDNAEPFNFRPYKTIWSFDLIYPLAMFVFSEGDADFYLLNYFQASDMLSRHETALFVQWLSSTKDMNYDFSYLYKKWKTNMGVFASGIRETRWTTLEDDSALLVKDRKKNSEGIIFRRPLNRDNRLELLLGRSYQDWSILSDYTSAGDISFYEDHEYYYKFSFIQDKSVYRFMDIVGGDRTNIGFLQSRGDFDSGDILYSASSAKGDINYDSLYFEKQFFIPLRFPDNMLALRLLGHFSWGPTPELFDISRWDRVRGLRTAPEKNRLVLLSAEYRFYIFPNIDYNLWWLLPPMFFQNLKGVLFYDAGECFAQSRDFKRDNLEHSIGFGFRLTTLLFQTYPLMISWDRARMLNRDSYETYFKLGMNW